MRNLFKVILFVLLLPQLVFASSEPILSIDSGGHRGVIWDIETTSDNKYLISASADTSIRVWDIDRKKEVRKILGQINKKSRDGAIYAIALSPNNKWLAVAGRLSSDSKTAGAIRIYDFKSGELVKLLVSHKNVVYDLDFSNDGLYLISGSADKTAKVWSVKSSFDLTFTLSGHNDAIYGVRALKNGDFVSTSLDKTAILWRDGEINKQYKGQARLLSIDSNDEFIAVTERDLPNRILIFNHSLVLQKTIKSDTRPIGLSFSTDGRYLASGSRSRPRNANIYDIRNNFTLKDSLKNLHTNLFKAVTFVDDLLITGGGLNNRINIHKLDSSDKDISLEGVGKVAVNIKLNDNGIIFDNDYDSKIITSNLNLKKIHVKYTPLDVKWSEWSLSHKNMTGRGPRTISISKFNKEVAHIESIRTTGNTFKVYGFTKNGLIVTGGGHGHLRIYDKKGRIVAVLEGHTGDIRSLSVHKNYLASGSDDQVIKLWNIGDLSLPKVDYKQLEKDKKYLHSIGKDMSVQEIMSYWDSEGKSKMYLTPPKNVYPNISLFADSNGEWVAWTESGYYAASANGDKYVGFHINHGLDKSAEFVPASQFYDSLYRPDIIRLAWKLGSEELAIAEAQKVKKTKVVDTVQLLPPRIILKFPTGRYIQTTDDSIALYFCIEKQNNTPLTDIGIMLNGRPIKERGLKIKYKKSKSKQCFNREVILAEGEKHQSITITARNQHSNANPVLIKVERIIQKIEDIYKPNLYVLSIGVSDYEDDLYDLEFAAKDASAITQVFSKQKRLFRTIKHKQLLNRDATKDNILDALDWIEQESTQRDLSVIFLAGHGVNNSKGSYYFLPYAANVDKLRRTGVKWSEFKDVVTELPGKTLLLVDSCRSGNIMGGKSRGIDDNITSAIKSITSEGTGQVIMTAATGSSVSIEDPKWGHGAFTKALIEGIDGRADYDDNGVVSIKELDLYVTIRVKKLTKGRQKPTTIIPGSVPDFAVGAN
jgi:WD40 repeat protein